MSKRAKITIPIMFVLIAVASLLLFYHNFQQKPAKISGAFKALNLWGRQRAYPNADIPNVSHFAAYKLAKQTLKKSQAQAAAVEPWKSIGPHNNGGRTLAVVFNPQNPNTIYAGSASGGLWRSYSAGVGAQAWEYVPTGYPVLGVSTIAIAPDDSNTIYIGTGEVYNYQTGDTGAAYRITRGSYGMGILKTTDGGLTWAPSLDWSYNQKHGIWAIRINPENSNTVWAATTEGTYHSYDAGFTWSHVHDVIMANDLLINPADTNIVMVTCGNLFSEGHGLYRSTDGGQTWTRKTDGLPDRFGGKALLAVAPSAPQNVYVSIGNSYGPNNATWLCSSFDSGETWNIVSEEDYSLWQGWFSHDVAVDPTMPLNVITAGIDIWKSQAGGIKLEQKSVWWATTPGPVPPGASEGPPYYSHADHHDIVFHPTDPNIIYFANDGGVFRSLDGGETFEGCNGGYQTVQFYNGFSCSQQDSNLAMGGLQDNGTIVYRGTTTWDRNVVGGDGCCSAIDAKNDRYMYASWQNLSLMKSTDRGRNFRRISVPGTNGPTAFVAPYVVAYDDPRVLYAGRDVVFKSTTRGSGWQATNGGVALDGNPVLVIAISHQSSDVVYAGTAPGENPPGVFRTTNGGDEWVDITGNLPDRFPGDLTVDPTDDSIVYITFFGFGSAHVFKSTDSGDNWEDISVGLPDLPTLSIAIDPEYPRNIYIGNDLGVYVSRFGGTAWEDFNDGLPDAIIAMDLVISPANRKLRVATHGNGAYERDLLDGIPAGLSENDTPMLDFTLQQNYPNPFNPNTQISFSLTKSTRVSLKIFNTLGQHVKTLVDNELKNTGKHQVVWDSTDKNGTPVAAGTYIYHLRAGHNNLSRKMTLTK